MCGGQNRAWCLTPAEGQLWTGTMDFWTRGTIEALCVVTGLPSPIPSHSRQLWGETERAWLFLPRINPHRRPCSH